MFTVSWGTSYVCAINLPLQTVSWSVYWKRSSLVQTKVIGAARIKATRFYYSCYLYDTHFRVYRIPVKLQLSMFQCFSLICYLFLHWQPVLWKTVFVLMWIFPVCPREFFHLYYIGNTYKSQITNYCWQEISLCSLKDNIVSSASCFI